MRVPERFGEGGFVQVGNVYLERLIKRRRLSVVCLCSPVWCSYGTCWTTDSYLLRTKPNKPWKIEYTDIVLQLLSILCRLSFLSYYPTRTRSTFFTRSHIHLQPHSCISTNLRIYQTSLCLLKYHQYLSYTPYTILQSRCQLPSCQNLSPSPNPSNQNRHDPVKKTKMQSLILLFAFKHTSEKIRIKALHFTPRN